MRLVVAILVMFECYVPQWYVCTTCKEKSAMAAPKLPSVGYLLSREDGGRGQFDVIVGVRFLVPLGVREMA